MKKLIILLTCILVLAVYAPCLAQSSDIFSSVEYHYVSELGKTRYLMEHRFLRDQFLSTPKDVIRIMSDNQSACALYQFVFDEAGVPFPYTPEDFSTRIVKVTPEIFILTITPPDPEYTPLCRRIHLVFDPAYQHLSHFTIEHSFNSDFYCTWDNGMHGNYGAVSRFDETTRNYNELLYSELCDVARRHAQRYGIPFDIDDINGAHHTENTGKFDHIHDFK